MTRNPADYRKFFTAECEITALHCDFLLNRSSLAQAGLLALNHDLTFHVFLNKEKEKRCAEEGKQLFFNADRYGQFLDAFKAYVSEAQEIFIPRYTTVPQNLSKEEFLAAAEFMGTFWYFYGFTEFPFIDESFLEARRTNNTEVLDRLESFARFKFIGREVLNAYWFEGGPLPNILLGLSRMFLEADDAKFLFLDELRSLFDGWRPSVNLVKERRSYYGAAVTDGGVEIFDFQEAKGLYPLFTSVSTTTVIKGVTANKGRVSGKVVIAPMLNDHAAIAAIDARMHLGDILVAETTGPDMVSLCEKAAAIVADQGGMLSHAAVVSRELGIPCVIQTGSATRQLKDGDTVEVDANEGIVRKI